MIAAIYARKSTAENDKHEQARSCEQQLAAAAEFCQRRGWTVGQTFRDDDVSGAEFVRRPGFTALRAALEATPRPFDVVVVMEFSRLGRDTSRSLAALTEIEDSGAQVWSYLDGSRISLESESDELRTVWQAMAATGERRKASTRTYAGMRPRFLAGAQLGGAPYGYVVARNGGPYAHLAIEPATAQTVRDVFRWYDAGDGLGKVVRRLNAAGISAPRGGAKGWTMASIGLMLRRPTYIGRRVWNQRKNRMRKGTRAPREIRPASEWDVLEAPELSIVDRDLFDRVQARIEQRATVFLRSQGGRLIGRPRGGDDAAVYLLSSLLICSRCGATLVGVTGSRQRPGYRCSSYHRRGVKVCGNGLTVKVAAIDKALIDAVAALLDPPTVAEAIRGAVATLTAGQADTVSRRATIAAELATIAGRERRLLDALVDGDGAVAESIKARLRDELARRDALAAELASLDTTTPIDTEALVQDVTRRAGDLRGLLRRHPMQARQVVRLLLNGGRFRCEPIADAQGRGIAYRITASGSYARLGVKGLEPFTLGNIGHAVRNHPYDGANRNTSIAAADISVAGTISSLRPMRSTSMPDG
jgi:site-specific DNA recombinase